MTQTTGLLLGLGVGLAVVALGLRLRARNALRAAYATSALSTGDYDALAARPGWRAWRVVLADGTTLNGLVRRPRESAAPWVLFLPGNDVLQLANGQRALEQLLGDHDWGAAVVAYRGFNGSGGTPRLALLHGDSEAVHDALRSAERLAPAQLHLVGYSLGGHVATYLAGALARRGSPAPSLSLLAPVEHYVLVRPGPLEKWVAGDSIQTLPMLAAVPAPVLVVQGADDETFFGPAQGRAIAAALDHRAEYVELARVGHVELLANDAALDRVRAFIAAHHTGTP